MSDRLEMIENIQRALRALDDAHASSQRLRAEPSNETLDAFKQQMLHLYDELQTLKLIFNHEGTYAADGLADLFSEFAEGKPSPFRRIERFEPKAKKRP